MDAPRRRLRRLGVLAFPDSAIATFEIGHDDVLSIHEFRDGPRETLAETFWKHVQNVAPDDIVITVPGPGRYRCRRTEGIVVAVVSMIDCNRITVAYAEEVQDIEHFFKSHLVAADIVDLPTYPTQSALRLVTAMAAARQHNLALGEDLKAQIEKSIADDIAAYEAEVAAARLQARTATIN